MGDGSGVKDINWGVGSMGAGGGTASSALWVPLVPSLGGLRLLEGELIVGGGEVGVKEDGRRVTATDSVGGAEMVCEEIMLEAEVS